MGVITASDLTFNGEEIKAVSEAVFESSFANPEMDAFHQIVTGIVAKKQIAILGRLGGLVGKGSGECNPTAGSNKITNSQKFWDPSPVSDRLTECWTDLQDTFFIWGLKKGIQRADLTSTDFLNFVEERLKEAIEEAIWRIVWFSDVDSATTTDSPAGVITAGTDVAYFNKINGFFKQIFAIVTADASRLTSGLATKNGQASYTLQAFNDTDTTNRVVTKMLQNLRLNSDTRLRNTAGVVILATQSVADQYERELIDSEKAYTTERLENGMSVLKSGGIDVIAVEIWDRIISAYYDNGTVHFRPHRAFLVDPQNMQVGVEGDTDLKELDVFYDKTDKEVHIDFAFLIDAKVVEDYKVQASY